ncbi:MAG: SHOCT domain-containing protein [Chloroflexi bacterium]|nr:MAG: SHOCT domain-containing protein [Chloroflexota bacterium]
MEPSRAGWLGWSSVILYAILAAASLALEVSQEGRSSLTDVWIVIAIFASALVGALIVNSRPGHPIGWMFCVAALSFGVGFFSRQYAIQALVVVPGTLPFGYAMAWFGFWVDMPGIAVVALFLPLLFPDGHLPSARWRPAAYFATGVVVVAVAVATIAPATYASAGYPSIRNPIGLDQYRAAFDVVDSIMQPLLLVLVVIGALALFDRVRHANADERQQLKWFGYAGALVLAAFLIEAAARALPSVASLRLASDAVALLALTALPAAVGIAILRYGLYDIDLIINRTLVYVLLTGVLAGVYTGAVALFQRLFVAMSGQGSDLAIVMTLFVVATVFTPVKNTLQEHVDRRIRPAGKALPAPGHHAGVDDLLMLAELHRRGVLTDGEFAAKKKQILGI